MLDKRLKLLKEAWILFENIEKKSRFLQSQYDAVKQKKEDAFDGKGFDEVVEILKTIDPISSKSGGKKTPYVNAVFNWWKIGNIAFPEDYEKIKDMLIRHKDLKQKGSKIKSADEFRTYSDMHKEIHDEWNKYFDDEGEEATEWEKYAPTVYSNKKYKVLQVDDYETGKKVFSNSGWCVAHEGHFNDYGPPYFLIVDRQSGERVALAHLESEQFKDIHDEPYTARNEYMDDIVENFFQQELEEYETNVIDDVNSLNKRLSNNKFFFDDTDSNFYKGVEANLDYDEYFDDPGSDFETYSSEHKGSFFVSKDLIDNFKPFVQISIIAHRSLTGYSYEIYSTINVLNKTKAITNISSPISVEHVQSKSSANIKEEEFIFSSDELPISNEKAQEVLNSISGEPPVVNDIKKEVLNAIKEINKEIKNEVA